MTVSNKMPALPEVEPAPDYLLLCTPYLAKRKSDGSVVTAIKVSDNVLVIEGSNTAQINASSFPRYYEVIRKFVMGEDTVTISLW